MCYIKRRKGKAIEAATLRGLKLHRYKRRAVITSDSGGYFLLSFKIWYVRLIRATTNVQNKKKSWYVIIAIPSFPLWSGGFTPPRWRGAALALWFSHADNIPYFFGPGKGKAGLTQLGGLIRHNFFVENKCFLYVYKHYRRKITGNKLVTNKWLRAYKI